jgi:hypothetical protein
MIQKAWSCDIEICPNLLTIVAKKLGEKEYVKFVMYEGVSDHSKEIMDWLNTRPTLIGYNFVDFDGQIIEFIWRSGGKFTAESVYAFVMTLPLNNPALGEFDSPYSEWDLTFDIIDLYRICHYNARKIGLKWLEFTTRWPILKDLPFVHDQPVSKSQIPGILSYNTNDVNVTEDFYYKCEPMVELRMELRYKYKQPRIINMSDSSIGSYIFDHILTKDYKKNRRSLKKGTTRTTIRGGEVVKKGIWFDSEVFKGVHQTFLAATYHDIKENGIAGAADQTVLFQDMAFVFGSGGLHACYKAGEYIPRRDETILSIDVKSYYPNLGITNEWYPEHIGKEFCKIYKGVYDDRGKYPKGSGLNYAYKIALNAVYGKSNSPYSIFYDPLYTLRIVVNGQLLLAMLAEQLSGFGRLLLVNTDGLEILIKKDSLAEVRDVCDQWEMFTDLVLEEDTYRKMVIRDVNNYIAISTKGEAKRKGTFELYEDITAEGGKAHKYNKTPNATIVPKALFEYYRNGVPIEETINNENNIFEFCYGIKKQKKFDYWLLTAEVGGNIDIDKRSEKVLRYYISPTGANIFKFWNDNRKNNITSVNKEQVVTLALNLRNPDIIREKKIPKSGGEVEYIQQYNPDRDHYINEAQRLIDVVSAETRDNAYLKYQKAIAILEKDDIPAEDVTNIMELKFKGII